MVVILKGATVFAADLLRSLSIPAELEFVRAASYGAGTTRGELRLAHKHDGLDLKGDYARETLKNLQSMWRRPVNLVTRVEGKGAMLRFDGQSHTDKKVDEFYE